jgi:hypothetical protein
MCAVRERGKKVKSNISVRVPQISFSFWHSYLVQIKSMAIENQGVHMGVRENVEVWQDSGFQGCYVCSVQESLPQNMSSFLALPSRMYLASLPCGVNYLVSIKQLRPHSIEISESSLQYIQEHDQTLHNTTTLKKGGLGEQRPK